MTTVPTTEAARAKTWPRLDVATVRGDFPILRQMVNHRALVYLDNAATSQKPQVVIDTIARYYSETNSNVHRGVHELSQKATEAYEGARTRIQKFINAPNRCEVVFVHGCTEAINLVAQSWGRPRLGSGDEILISHMEHHSNIVPWQILCEQTGAVLKVAPIDDRGALVWDEFENLLGERTRLVSIAHVSNALGTINPVELIIERAHAVGAVVLIDGAQAVPHMAIDVQALDCDFYTFSGHKLFGPTGTGVLYGKRELLEAMPPYQTGGDMIKSVSFDGTIYNDLPYKFEAGTPHIAGPIGLAAAIDYVQALGLATIAAHEHDLLEYGTQALNDLDGVRQIGTAPEKTGILSFVVEGVHAHDVGTILDHEGVAIRTGHHCAQPVMDRFGVAATARASLAFYNCREDINALIRAIHQAIEVFK